MINTSKIKILRDVVMLLHAQIQLLRVNRIDNLLLSGKQQVHTWKRGGIELGS